MAPGLFNSPYSFSGKVSIPFVSSAVLFAFILAVSNRKQDRVHTPVSGFHPLVVLCNLNKHQRRKQGLFPQKLGQTLIRAVVAADGFRLLVKDIGLSQYWHRLNLTTVEMLTGWVSKRTAKFADVFFDRV